MRGVRFGMVLTIAILSVGARAALRAQDPPSEASSYKIAQGDPADSLYRLARDLLNRGDYGTAATAFKNITQKFPNSRFARDLPYYEAFARYRLGTTDELRTAARLLEPRASSIIGNPAASSATSSQNRARDADLVALFFRINLALANRGEANAAAAATKAAQAGNLTCDRENTQIRVEAMNVLDQVNPDAALQLVRQVIQTRDECNEDLRRRSVFILGRRGDAEAASVLARMARTDPSIAVRTEAIGWLPKLQGDAGVNALGQMLREEKDELIQRALVRTLASSDNARARANIRLLIDRNDAPVTIRVEGINRLNYDRSSGDDAAYLRGLYTRTDDLRVKEAVINAISRIGGQDNEQWMMRIALNGGESSQLRSVAMAKLVRLSTPIADLTALYDASDALSIRQQIINVLERRPEPEAADKLVDIVRNGTGVMAVRLQALTALGNRKDARSARLLQEIIDGKKP